MSRLNRIITNQDISGGKPIIKGTRISVALILEILASGGSFEEILTAYDHLTREDILACLEYAHRIVENVQGTSLANA